MKAKYIAGRVGHLQVLEDEFPLAAVKYTSHQAFSNKSKDVVFVRVAGLRGYTFDAPVRGRVKEWSQEGERVVCRVADDAVLADVADMDALIVEAEARLAELRMQRQVVMEAALPRLEVAPVAKEIVDCSEKRSK